MKQHYQRVLYLLLFAAIVGFLQLGYASPQGIGVSQIIFSNTVVSASQGSSSSFYYMVKLFSGTTWGTSLSVLNSQNLSSSGISIKLSQSYGDPTYSGIATVTVAPYTTPGNYSAVFQANGDDPSPAATLTIRVLGSAGNASSTGSSSASSPSAAMPTFKIISAASKVVNASTGASLSVQSGTIKAVIKPGTYVLVNGIKESTYNFSLIAFSIANVTSPPNTSLMPGEAYAFAVNGKITPSISFVNASGADEPIISYVIAGPNTTSWTWFGGNYSNGTYKGGSYKFADTWLHYNSTAMVNKAFFKPVLWVFESPAPSTSTPTSTHSPSNTSAPSNATTIVPSSSKTPSAASPSSSASTYIYVAAAVVIIIIIAGGIVLRSKGRQKAA
ncbi:MAG: hypothetical protein ACP5NE_03435 [Candidatus Micrarchaeia archaeon]